MMPVTDLNFDARRRQPLPQICGWRLTAHVHRQTRLLPSHRAHAVAHLPRVRAALRRQPQGQVVYLSRSVPLHGIRTTHRPREPAGYRGLPSRPAQEALPHGDPRWDLAQYPGQCQQGARLAHLCRLRPSPDPDCTPPRRRGRLRRGPGQYGYALDASTIDLCLSLFPWAPSCRTKAAVKLHTLLDLRGNIPTFIQISDGKLRDVNVLDLLTPEPGAFSIMDRGYLDFARLYRLALVGAFFLIRAKSNTQYRRLYSRPVDTSTGLKCDQTIRLTGAHTPRYYPEKLRRIKYYDTSTDKTFAFLTNNFSLPALTIADLYRCRWQVELFFKWIKQHLRIKAFFATSENAVKSQIWIAVAVYVLVAIIRKRLKIDVSLYTILQVLSLTVFERIPLNQIVTDTDCNSVQIQNSNQLNLFE